MFVNWTVPMTTTPLLLSTLALPALVKVAVPSGTLGLDDQLVGSVQSVLPPVQVPSTACAATTPSAVVASRVASEWRVTDRNLDPIQSRAKFGPGIGALKSEKIVVSMQPGRGAKPCAAA
ncbi:hypothetical protein ACVI1J_001187 [Bradyrhizobium diazoefficiens]